MNNPDERTAVEQFGKGDKYFGVCTLMITMPGLPMFGHGQIEGYAEKYGMEYRRAYWDESPDPWLVERHEREIVPLLRRRNLFDELMDPRRGAIKAALMDQRLVAGVGNLMSDEILWRARVHPSTPVRSLGSRARGRLYDALHAVVGESVRYGRVPHGERWLTRVRDDRGARCPRCRTPLRRSTIAGRTACWCPRCQRAQ